MHQLNVKHKIYKYILIEHNIVTNLHEGAQRPSEGSIDK